MIKIRKIISGGQTGADRAALDFAIENGIEISGFIPRGRWAEDGPLADRYTNLLETRSRQPVKRTELNVKYSDGTLIVSHGPLTGGSKKTLEFANKHLKPVLHVDLDNTTLEAAAVVCSHWIAANNIVELNVAGPRASKDPIIHGATKKLLKAICE